MCSWPRPITCTIDRQAMTQWQASSDLFNLFGQEGQTYWPFHHSKNAKRLWVCLKMGNNTPRPTLLFSTEHDDTPLNLGVFGFPLNLRTTHVVLIWLEWEVCGLQYLDSNSTVYSYSEIPTRKSWINWWQNAEHAVGCLKISYFHNFDRFLWLCSLNGMNLSHDRLGQALFAKVKRLNILLFANWRETEQNPPVFDGPNMAKIQFAVKIHNNSTPPTR